MYVNINSWYKDISFVAEAYTYRGVVSRVLGHFESVELQTAAAAAGEREREEEEGVAAAEQTLARRSGNKSIQIALVLPQDRVLDYCSLKLLRAV